MMQGSETSVRLVKLLDLLLLSDIQLGQQSLQQDKQNKEQSKHVREVMILSHVRRARIIRLMKREIDQTRPILSAYYLVRGRITGLGMMNNNDKVNGSLYLFS